MQDKHHLIHLRLKSEQNLKLLSLNFDSAVHQTFSIFQKSSGFLKLEPILSNIEMYIV